MPFPRLIAAHWPLWAVCALFLLVAAFTLDDYGPPLDWGTQRLIGTAALDYLAGDGERAFDQLRVPSDRYYGAAFEAPLVLILERALGLKDSRDILLGGHLLMHLFFLAGGVFCYLLVLRMFDSRPLALVALSLFLLHPRLYAHSFVNSKDVPFLAMFMISLYLAHRAFRRDTLGAFLLCGVGVGLLVNLRIMGVILFAAVLALRALDLAFAGSAEKRRRVLLAGGAFALAAMFTYHASLPALWTDPVGLTDLARTLGAIPHEAFNLFRGEWLYSRDGPPWDYAPVWVGITTPPATLLLALAGTVALARNGLRRPRDLLRNGPPRFGLLLALLPVATAAAVVILESNIHGDWRHLYFLYAPLLLLAVVGLVAAGGALHGRWTRAGAYALAGAATAVALVSMVRIHPLQSDYFNFLVDRTTPEHLNSSYTMNYSLQASLYLLKDVSRDHPSGALHLSIDHLKPLRAIILPADDRERIVGTRDFRSGDRNFYRVRAGDCSPPFSIAPIPRASRIYAATLECLVDPVAWFGRFRREALASDEPPIRSTYDIHRDGRILTYLRDGCPRTDVERDGPRFFLHVVPVDDEDLPLWRRKRGHGFENLDFAVRDNLARIDGNCIATARLPDYPIASVRTGQFTGDGPVWEVEFTPDGRVVAPPAPPDYAAARREALAREPLAHSVYDIYRDGRMLTYLREGCTDEEANARFFLHVVPADEGDLPEHRREHGFDNLDFTLAARGARLDGNCVAVAVLPEYPIATVRTGQYDDAGALWTAEFALPAGE